MHAKHATLHCWKNPKLKRVWSLQNILTSLWNTGRFLCMYGLFGWVFTDILREFDDNSIFKKLSSCISSIRKLCNHTTVCFPGGSSKLTSTFSDCQAHCDITGLSICPPSWGLSAFTPLYFKSHCSSVLAHRFMPSNMHSCYSGFIQASIFISSPHLGPYLLIYGLPPQTVTDRTYTNS